jgi:hypothetical protein
MVAVDIPGSAFRQRPVAGSRQVRSELAACRPSALSAKIHHPAGPAFVRSLSRDPTFVPRTQGGGMGGHTNNEMDILGALPWFGSLRQPSGSSPWHDGGASGRAIPGPRSSHHANLWYRNAKSISLQGLCLRRRLAERPLYSQPIDRLRGRSRPVDRKPMALTSGWAPDGEFDPDKP